MTYATVDLYSVRTRHYSLCCPMALMSLRRPTPCRWCVVCPSSDHCWPGATRKPCRFRDALTRSSMPYRFGPYQNLSGLYSCPLPRSLRERIVRLPYNQPRPWHDTLIGHFSLHRWVVIMIWFISSLWYWDDTLGIFTNIIVASSMRNESDKKISI